MYRLSDYLHDVWKVSPLPQCDLICAEADAESMFVSNRMHDTLACYAFAIVNSGWLKIVSNGREQTLQRNDLYSRLFNFHRRRQRRLPMHLPRG